MLGFIMYKNLSGDSNVKMYKYTIDAIYVVFGDLKRCYVYTVDSVGKENLDMMKRLADEGSGLNGFIIRNVRKYYKTIIEL